MRFDLWDSDDWAHLGYGRWREARAGKYEAPDHLSGSDYSGNLVERSNRDAWRDMYADGEGDWWREVHGGHGTFAIVVEVGRVPEDAQETLDGLHDYPLIDEEAHSALEAEAQSEAWDRWAAKDFAEALLKRFAPDDEPDVEDEEPTARVRWYAALGLTPPEADDTEPLDADDLDADVLADVFRRTAEAMGQYWSNEEGDSMWIDVERIADAVTREDWEHIIHLAPPAESRQLALPIERS